MAESLSEHMFVRYPAPLHAAPDSASEQVSEVLPGEPLTALDHRNSWVRVETAYAYAGWVEAAALGGAGQPEWLQATTDDPVAHARTLLGAPYRWGGMTERGIDCSGLVHMSFRAAGRLVPRDADLQEAAGTELDDPQPGDLVSYGTADGADHVAFWLGDGRILHAAGRDDTRAVLEEPEPAELRARRRKFFRF